MTERVAVITGGAGELARAIASALESDGFRVRAPDRATLDVTVPEQVRDYFAAIEHLDLLINNAGRARGRALRHRCRKTDWDAVVSTNLRGAFLCSQAAGLKMMRQRSGHIINIGSFSARFGTCGQSNYAAAKAGLIGLTQSMARELGKRSVRVNCVLPGFLETKFTADMSDEMKQRALQNARTGEVQHRRGRGPLHRVSGHDAAGLRAGFSARFAHRPGRENRIEIRG